MKRLLFISALFIAGAATANYHYKSSALNSTTIMQAQEALSNQGYNVRPDGVHGPMTEAAIRRFQIDRGLSQTGLFDSQTLGELGVSTTMDTERAPASISAPVVPEKNREKPVTKPFDKPKDTNVNPGLGRDTGL